MWTHFCRKALRAEPNFFFFLDCQEKIKKIGHKVEKNRVAKNTIKKNSSVLHCSFSKKKKKKLASTRQKKKKKKKKNWQEEEEKKKVAKNTINKEF